MLVLDAVYANECGKLYFPRLPAPAATSAGRGSPYAASLANPTPSCPSLRRLPLLSPIQEQRIYGAYPQVGLPEEQYSALKVLAAGSITAGNDPGNSICQKCDP